MKKVVIFGVLIPTSLFLSYIFLSCNLEKVKVLKECLDSIDNVVSTDIK